MPLKKNDELVQSSDSPALRVISVNHLGDHKRNTFTNSKEAVNKAN